MTPRLILIPAALVAAFLLSADVDVQAQTTSVKPPFRLDQLTTQPATTLPCNPTGSQAVLVACTLGSGLAFSGTSLTATGGGGGLSGMTAGQVPLAATASTVTSSFALGTGMQTFLTTPSSANLLATMTDETGTGVNVFSISPSLTTPSIAGGALTGTFSGTHTISGAATFSTAPTFSSITGSTQCLHVSTSGALSGTGSDCGSGGGSGITGLANGQIPLGSGTTTIGSGFTPGAGVQTFLTTPTSANLRAALTDEAGTGIAYFVGGALGTPASATLTNATGLPLGGIVNTTPSRLLGNPTGSAAPPSEIPLGTGLTFSGGALTATGTAGVGTFGSTNSTLACSGTGANPSFTGSVACDTTTSARTTATAVTWAGADGGKLVVSTGGGAVTIGAATTTLGNGWGSGLINRGPAATITASPTASILNGNATLPLGAGQGVDCVSLGGEYHCMLGMPEVVPSGVLVSSTGRVPIWQAGAATQMVLGNGTLATRSFAIGPGFSKTVGTDNAGPVVVGTDTLFGQNIPTVKGTGTYTVNLTTDANHTFLANAAAVVFALPQAVAGNKGAWVCFGDNASFGYTINSTTSTFYGMAGLSSTTAPVFSPKAAVCAGSDGTNWLLIGVPGVQVVDTPVTLTDAATIATDASQGNVFDVSIAATRILGNPTNARNGQTLVWRISKTGAFNLTYGTQFKWPGGIAPTLTATTGTFDRVTCLKEATNLFCSAQLDFK